MKKSYVPVLIILGILLVILGVYYFMTAAGSLPHWLPGYEAGSAHKHTKHGAAAIILAVGSFIWAWFASGSKPDHKPKSKQSTETE